MHVPFLDLQREWQLLESELTQAFVRFGRSANYVLGEPVTAFEHAFASAHGYAYGVGVGSGLSALEIGLLAEGVQPGDEVITVANSAVATALAISRIGARPVFCDVGTDFLMDTAQLERLITPRTKAIVPVHLFGMVCPLQSVGSVAQRYGVCIVEDACQAHGADFEAADACTYTKAFSFYPTKNLGGYGESGMILTQREEIRDFARHYRDYGQVSRYVHAWKGTNSRIDALQCALLHVKLSRMAEYVQVRRALAERYTREFEQLPSIHAPVFLPTSAPHIYVLRVSGGLRDALQTYLVSKGISTLVHYPTPIHRQPCYAAEYTHVQLPITEQLQSEILSLPCHPFLTEREQEYVIQHVRNFFQTV